MKFIKLKLAEVLPNPYRNLGSYTLQATRLEALEDSIEQTGFWNNVIGRINQDGRFEIAYGHHRLEAAKRVLGEDYEHTFPTADLNDYTMLQMMAAENSEAWMNTTAHDNETVIAARDILNDYLDEYPTWDLSEDHAKGDIHGITHKKIVEWFSDSQHYGKAQAEGVGAYSIAHLLSWKNWKVKDAIANLPLDKRAKAAIAAKKKAAAKMKREAEARAKEAARLAREAADDEAKARAEAKEKAIKEELRKAEVAERQAAEAEEKAGALSTKAVEMFEKPSHAKAFRQTVTTERFRKQLDPKKQPELAKKIIKNLGAEITAKGIEREAEKVLRKQTSKLSHLDPMDKYGYLMTAINGKSEGMHKAFIDLRDVMLSDGVKTLPEIPFNTDEALRKALTAIINIYAKFGMEPPMISRSGAMYGNAMPTYPQQPVDDIDFIDGVVVNEV